jgi:hypothetical protein
MDYTKQRSSVGMDISQNFLEKLFSDNDSKELKKLIEKYSYGKVIAARQIHTTNYELPDKSFYTKIKDLINSKIGLDSVDQKAVLILRFTDGKPFRMSIPAPKEDLFYYVEGQGLRVTADKGDEIAKSLSKFFSGRTVQFIRGYHTGKQ